MNHDHAKRYADVLDKMAELAKSNAATAVSLAAMMQEAAEAFREITGLPLGGSQKTQTARDIRYFEVVCEGYNGATDATDGRVLWVSAESAEQLEDALMGTGAEFSTKGPWIANNLDYRLPIGAQDLHRKALSFKRP